MDIIIKHKKVFIILVIVATVLVGFIGTGVMTFNFVGSSKVEITNEGVVTYGEHDYEVIPDNAIQQDEKFRELDFSNGPVVFNKTVEHKDGYATGGGDIVTAYLHKGDILEFSYTAKIRKGNLGYNLLSKYGQQYSGIITGSNSSGDNIVVEEDGNYVFNYSMNDFRGKFEMTVIVSRPE